MACSAQGIGPLSAPASRTGPPTDMISGDGALAAPSAGDKAVTYDPQLAPVGAKLDASLVRTGNSTQVTLMVSGLKPNRGYAAHAHTESCGATGAAAGPHYQNQVDPAATSDKPSTDPAYANPKNEIWLDLTTDANGTGEANVNVPFTFTDRSPGSIVLHKDTATKTGPGEAGTAGDRIACLTLAQGEPAGH